MKFVTTSLCTLTLIALVVGYFIENTAFAGRHTQLRKQLGHRIAGAEIPYTAPVEYVWRKINPTGQGEPFTSEQKEAISQRYIELKEQWLADAKNQGVGADHLESHVVPEANGNLPSNDALLLTYLQTKESKIVKHSSHHKWETPNNYLAWKSLIYSVVEPQKFKVDITPEWVDAAMKFYFSPIDYLISERKLNIAQQAKKQTLETQLSSELDERLQLLTKEINEREQLFNHLVSAIKQPKISENNNLVK